MPTLTSADGTTIGYESSGNGPALILVDGAMCYRAAGPMRPLAALLTDDFTVYTYDRRGRGESTDTLPYAVAREVEDLAALIERAGGAAYVYAMSSGGALALATAAARLRGSPSWRCTSRRSWPRSRTTAGSGSTRERLRELLDAGQAGDAVALFMTNVGVPAQAIAGMRAGPGWAMLEAIAPTLAYDDQVLTGGRIPRDLAATITIPALVVGGGSSPHGLQQAAKATADALPTAEHRTLEGQTHDVAPDALAPVLVEFFRA